VRAPEPERPPIVIYTDASYEPDSRAYRRGLGHASTTNAPPPTSNGFGRHGWAVTPDIYDHCWRSRSRIQSINTNTNTSVHRYIGQLEALVVAVSVYYSLRGGVPYPGGTPHDVRERDVIHFVDNFGSMMGLIKGQSRDADI